MKKSNVNNFVSCCLQGEVPEAEKMIDEGVNLNGQSGDFTALIAAVYYDKPKVIEMLLRRGADVNKTTSHGVSALGMATEEACLPIIKMLIAHNADPLLLSEGLTPRDIVHRDPWRYESCEEFISVLSGYTPLHEAVLKEESQADLSAIGQVLDSTSDINIKDFYGNTALMIAVLNDCRESFKLLLQRGADVNTRNHADQSALMLINDGTDEMHELLVAQGANASYVNSKEWCALCSAAQYSRLNLLELLQEAGGNPLRSGAMNPFFAAALGNAADSLQYLTDSGWEITYQDPEEGFSALMIAVAENCTNAAEWLIRQGAPLNQQQPDGYTALMVAAGNNSTDCLTLLINHGADWEMEEENGKTALEIAKEEKCTKCSQLLQQAIKKARAAAREAKKAAKEAAKKSAEVPEATPGKLPFAKEEIPELPKEFKVALLEVDFEQWVEKFREAHSKALIEKLKSCDEQQRDSVELHHQKNLRSFIKQLRSPSLSINEGGSVDYDFLLKLYLQCDESRFYNSLTFGTFLFFFNGRSYSECRRYGKMTNGSSALELLIPIAQNEGDSVFSFLYKVADRVQVNPVKFTINCAEKESKLLGAYETENGSFIATDFGRLFLHYGYLHRASCVNEQDQDYHHLSDYGLDILAQCYPEELLKVYAARADLEEDFWLSSLAGKAEFLLLHLRSQDSRFWPYVRNATYSEFAARDYDEYPALFLKTLELFRHVIYGEDNERVPAELLPEARYILSTEYLLVPIKDNYEFHQLGTLNHPAFKIVFKSKADKDLLLDNIIKTCRSSQFIADSRLLDNLLEMFRKDFNAASRRQKYFSLLLSLLGHRSEALRNYAGKKVQENLKAMAAELEKLLSAKSAFIRQQAVHILGKSKKAKHIDHFSAALRTEKAAAVRTEICQVLLPLWSKKKMPARTEIIHWLDLRVLPKKMPVGLEVDKLQIKLLDGSHMNKQEISHLIATQSSYDAMEIHPEIRPWLALIDRQQNLPSAKALVSSYMRKPDVKFRYALLLGALLADDSFIPELVEPIEKWAKAGRTKQAQVNILALAFIGTPEACMKLEEIMHAYRSKRPYLADAALEAMEMIARERGLTVEELGDEVIPDLGFTPGKPLIIDSCELEISPQGKWQFFVNGKRLASAPATIKPKMKTLNASLRSLMKAQAIRHNRMLVQQRHWTVSSWKKLYMKNQVLKPFLNAQIWGYWDKGKKLAATFRGDTGSLIQVDSSIFTLPASGKIGLIHPLDLDAGALQLWREHFSKAKIKTQVEQLERTIRVIHDEEKTWTYSQWELGENRIGDMRSKIERLGWMKVQEGANIVAYRKVFKAAGVLAQIDTYYCAADDHFISAPIDGLEFRTLSDSSTILSFSQVPPIVFCEAVTETMLIASKADEISHNA